MKYLPTSRSYGLLLLALAASLLTPAQAKDSSPLTNRNIKVQVVALDQPWMWNRLGASQPGGMIFALARDVVKQDGTPLPDDLTSLPPLELSGLAGAVRLRDTKRARPLVLRADVGDCLVITFVNLLATKPVADQTKAPKTFTRWAGLHATGMELMGGIESDGSWVGRNASSLAKNGEWQLYRWYAAEEGTFLLYSPADTETGSQTNQGLFGAINVEPEGAEWYRSQVTHDDLEQATLTTLDLKGYFRSTTPVGGAPDPIEKAGKKLASAAQSQPVAKSFVKRAMTTNIADKLGIVPVEVEKQSPEENDADINDTRDVERGIVRRIHAASGQPLIYYNAIYTDGNKPCLRNGRTIPVLHMLQASPVGTPLFDAPLQKPEATAYFDDLRALDAGIVPTDLRDLFKNQIKRELSAGVRVVERYRFSWLVMDQGDAFYVQVTPPGGAKPGQITISKAELELICSDLTAVITGPNAGRFPLSNTSASFRVVPASPDRRQPFREYTIIYHQALFTAQAFAAFSNINLQSVIQPGADNFAINYGAAAIGPEVIANRLGVGPMGNKDAVDLKFEEFFLSSWAMGDPAMVVDHPANAANAMVGSPADHRALRTTIPKGSVQDQLGLGGTLQQIPAGTDDFAPVPPEPPVKATKAFFPDDPSNVYHSYMNDHVKFRLLHAGPGPSHVHHLHAHQWLRSSDSDSSAYLDSQLIIPGSAYTLEIAYGGSGNRNKTVGDAIFHCHFYPHFAQGMWALWRVHDVFEDGTRLKDGVPVPGINRALPDGEIAAGTPIPAIVPLPTLGMAPVPARVQLTDLAPWKAGEGQGRKVEVLPEANPDPAAEPKYRNPGYPFFVPGVAGHRAPHPPLDFAWLEDPATRLPIFDGGSKIYLDGGLPRHVVLDGKVVREYHNRWDFSKDTALRKADGTIAPGGELTAVELPEGGTPVERAAMNEHATRTRPTAQPNGDPGNFILNGLPPTNGAPFADPGVTDDGNASVHRRRYQGADFQLDTTFNKKGWHYPQQRMISLWQDVKPTVERVRPAQPFFFRTNTSDSIQFWQTNLLPSYYDLDDFQVRTPTDIVGQHIHLVKFDVTASDGAANGFNYEDGTFAPEEVQERIASINATGGLLQLDPKGEVAMPAERVQLKLKLKLVKDYYPPADSKFDKLVNGVPTWKSPLPGTESIFGKPPPLSRADSWDGAQTTIQLWDVDPLLNDEGVDRTLRTVFTHDHFGPSTHQQAGLYGGMVVEPENSEWYLPNGNRMNTRLDGGPTSWNGYIVTENPRDSYREFMLEFQDLQLAYAKGSRKEPSSNMFNPKQKEEPASALFEISQAHSLAQLAPLTTDQPKDTMANWISDYYVEQLNSGVLPGETTFPCSSLVVPGFSGLFPQFGVPLSNMATVAVDVKDEQWTITEAAGVVNAGSHYVVRRPARPLPAKTQDHRLFVFTPDLAPSWADSPINVPKVDTHFVLNPPKNPDNGINGPPFAQIVSQNEVGTYSLNYRNEPAPFRLGLGADADPALLFKSMTRGDPDLNSQPNLTTESLVPNARGTDPYTPLLEAYVNDHVQIRTLVGAHTEAHALQIHGVKWLFEPDNTNSGWRSAQLMGLSEHFEMRFDLPGTVAEHPGAPLLLGTPPFADYFYSPSSDIVGLNNGLWGIIRAYGGQMDGVKPLPNNPQPAGTLQADLFHQGYDEAIKNGGHTSAFEVCAITASKLPGGKLIYKPATATTAALATDQALLFMRQDDLKALKPGDPVEPLILRVAAGDWIKVTLHNDLVKGAGDPALDTPQRLPYGTPFNGTPFMGLPNEKPTLNIVPITPSRLVGLHPQLVGYDILKANGVLVGFNPQDQLIPPGQTVDLYWYAGEVKRQEDGTLQAKPIEFGATNLLPAELLLQPQFGMVGALIVEPQGATWIEDATSRASASVKVPGGSDFREFVVISQNMVANSASSDSPLRKNLPGSTSIGAINYRTEPFFQRQPEVGLAQNPPQPPLPPAKGFSNVFSKEAGVPPGDPWTPVFVAAAGTPVRFRLLTPSTVTSNAVNAPPVFILHGHHWQEEPYIADSTKIGFNPFSETHGAVQASVGQKFDLLLPSAGGSAKVPGDYLYLTYQTAKDAGTWGLFRVTGHQVAIEKATFEGGIVQVGGVVRKIADGEALPKVVHVYAASQAAGTSELGTAEVRADGRWTFKGEASTPPSRLQAQLLGPTGEAGPSATVELPGISPDAKLTLSNR